MRWGKTSELPTDVVFQHETTASALTWTCHLCAKYPEIQKKLRAEIHEAIPSHDAPITSDLLEGMPYLNGVCEETLRLYPTGQLFLYPNSHSQMYREVSPEVFQEMSQEDVCLD